MVLTTSELIASLQNEVRILLHLASKIDPSMRDYRPTPKQRSTIELLTYLSVFGPMMVQFAKDGIVNPPLVASARQAAEARDFDETLAAIAAHTDEYAGCWPTCPPPTSAARSSGSAPRPRAGPSSSTG